MIVSGSTVFESAQRDEQPVVVKLSGEFDIRYLRRLENMLRDCLASGRSTLVDLSEVTFMDSRCVWSWRSTTNSAEGAWSCAILPGTQGLAWQRAIWRIGSISSTRPILGCRQAAPQGASLRTRQGRAEKESAHA